ncbi:potassium channel subfamily U member 1 [Tiliqua scincoides]|uniref:potassium channel subfamily U member 1 n=1 Tax=Tiliqua scincoides TaxID=71010 RepID=UPI003462C250
MPETTSETLRAPDHVKENVGSDPSDLQEWSTDLGTHCTQYVQLAFMSGCLSIFLGGIMIILLFRILQHAFCCCVDTGQILQVVTLKNKRLTQWKGKFQDWIVMMLSAQTAVGRVLVILVFLFSIGSLIIYIMNCYSVTHFCLSFEDQTVFIDLFFNIFFLFYFGLRFLAASDKLNFWLELNSIVDFFTITPVCISFYLGRNWLGLRFLRALRLLELPKILQFLYITTSGTAIKLSKLLAVFISTWLTAAGFLHWMENAGDPWLQKSNYQHISYFESLYLIMVTMSTVGYGDIVAKTTLGRAFVLFFIIGGLILFANLVPEVVDIVRSTKIHKGAYEAVKGRKYLVVCGYINLHSVTVFLKDFISQDTGEVTTEIIFLGENTPCVELETMFRCYAAYTTFFQGSVMVYEDLKRVKMEHAEACLILADTCSAQPYIEDTSNIMRVLSIKNHYPHTRVIVQIIQSANKVYLPKLPNWDWTKGDSIICFAELKLGLIAQNCLVPGLTTLLTSLFIREDSQKVSSLFKHQLEVGGKEYKVMTWLLSNDFVDMSFQDVCRLCFVKLNLVLLAIEFRTPVHGKSILINPTSAAVKVHYDTMGFFIAKSPVEVRRARYYCRQCHNDIINPDLIGKCRCKMKTSSKSVSFLPLDDQESNPNQHLCIGAPEKLQTYRKAHLRLLRQEPRRRIQMHRHADRGRSLRRGKCAGPSSKDKKKAVKQNFYSSESQPETSQLSAIIPTVTVSDADRNPEIAKEDSDTILDSTGMFHWCEPVPFEQAVLKKHKKKLSQDFHNHIVVCLFGDATSPLIGLRNFVMPLRASNYSFSELKDILFVGNLEYLQREWEFLQNFPRIYVFEGSALSCADLKSANIKDCTVCAILSAHARGPGDQTLVDTKSVLATFNLRSLQLRPYPVTGKMRSPEESRNQSHMFTKNIPVITELKIASNAQLFEQREKDASGYLNLNKQSTQGMIFSDSFLDSLFCTTFHNHYVLALLQALVTGGTNPELEEYFAEEKCLSGTGVNMAPVGLRNRCKLALFPVANNPSSLHGMKLIFGEVYLKALDMFGILCFGLYRLKEGPNPYENRKVLLYVIARPPTFFEVLPSDQVFCLAPFNISASDLLAVVSAIPFRRRKSMTKSKSTS